VDHQVVLGDDPLALELRNPLAQVDLRLDPVQERHDEVQPGLQGLLEPAKPLHVRRVCLRDDPDGLDYQRRRQGHRHNGEKDPKHYHDLLPGIDRAVAPSSSMTSTLLPAGMTRFPP
jgi:hypothetical protein